MNDRSQRESDHGIYESKDADIKAVTLEIGKSAQLFLKIIRSISTYPRLSGMEGLRFRDYSPSKENIARQASACKKVA